MTAHDPHEIEIVPRRSRWKGCDVISIIADPADAQQVLYGTVTRDGVLVGIYYCVDPVRQSGWRIVTALGHPLTTLDGRPVKPRVRTCRRPRADHHPHRPRHPRDRTATPRHDPPP